MVLQANDTISAKEGTATAIINNRVYEIAELRNIDATVDFDKQDVKTLGKRGTQHKITGFSGSGNMNIYYITSMWRQVALTYMKTGKVTPFDIVLKNQDPASNTGKQVTKLMGCLLDGVTLAKLNVDGDILDEDVNFTFDDADLLTPFDNLD